MSRLTLQRVVIVGVLLTSASLVAQEAGQPGPGNRARKAAWEWTLEERLAARTNAAAALERVRARVPGRIATTAEHGPIADDFDGRTHPELFLPHEVFRQLIHLALIASPRINQSFRESVQPELDRRGFPPDFWERLHALCAVHAADLRAVDELEAALRRQRHETSPATLGATQEVACGSRADALAAVREEFGPQRFDRFLYDVIAVRMFHTAARLLDPALLHRAERGCR